MAISETMTLLRTAKKGLKEATERVEMCDRTVNRLLNDIPHHDEDIERDFRNFCNNSLSVINEDFEDIRDPNEVWEDIKEALDLVGDTKHLDFDSQDEVNREGLARCNAYLAVRDRWLAEICNAIEQQ